MMDNMESGGSSDKESKGVEVELTDGQKRQLDNGVKKQKEFLNGETKKQGKLSKKDTKIVKTMEEAGVTQETAGEGLETKYDYRTNSYKKSGTKVIVIKKLTKDMIEEEMFPSVLTNSHWRSEEYDVSIFLVVFNLVLNLVRNYKFVVSHVRLSGQDLIVDVLIRD